MTLTIVVANEVADVERPDESVGAVAAADRLESGPITRTALFAGRDRARGELCDLDEEELEVIAAEGPKVAGSLEEEGAR